MKQPLRHCWLIIHAVAPSLHNSFPQHNLAPCPTGRPERKTITREAEQQYPENICSCRQGPSVCLPGSHRGHMLSGHGWGARVCRAQPPALRWVLPSACSPAHPPASLAACLLWHQQLCLNRRGPACLSSCLFGQNPFCLEETLQQNASYCTKAIEMTKQSSARIKPCYRSTLMEKPHHGIICLICLYYLK